MLQVNDPKPKCKSVSERLKRNKRKVRDWPSPSLDLNKLLSSVHLEYCTVTSVKEAYVDTITWIFFSHSSSKYLIVILLICVSSMRNLFNGYDT